MSAVVVLVVVLSGYYFSDKYPLARFKQIRSTGWATYFHLSAYGIGFGIAAALVVGLTDYFDLASSTVAGMGLNLSYILKKTSLSNQNARLAAWSACSFILAYSWGSFSNTLHAKEKAAKKLAQQNELENILYTSAKDVKMIQVTLKNRKVYIGYVCQTPSVNNLDKREYFTIFPLLSGYRDPDTLALELTNSYSAFYAQLSELPEDWQNFSNEFKTLIVCSELTSLAHFDSDAYKKINKSSLFDRANKNATVKNRHKTKHPSAPIIV